MSSFCSTCIPQKKEILWPDMHCDSAEMIFSRCLQTTSLWHRSCVTWVKVMLEWVQGKALACAGFLIVHVPFIPSVLDSGNGTWKLGPHKPVTDASTPICSIVKENKPLPLVIFVRDNQILGFSRHSELKVSVYFCSIDFLCWYKFIFPQYEEYY